MFPTYGSESVGVTAVGGVELIGGVHGVPWSGGGAEMAGGGVHAALVCAGGECAEIEAGALDEVANCDDAADAGSDGCHATPGGNPFALRASSLALTTPYVKQPIIMQISAPNNEIAKSNPSPRITV